MSPQTRSEIKELLERHDLAPIHRLGQHFLADANITRKIVEVAGLESGTQVVEIGAGTGSLTRALADAAATVVSYEIDGRLRPLLADVTQGLDVDLRFEDVMKADLDDDLGPGEWVMVANLPYNVGTPLVLETLRRVPKVIRFVVMVQKEVALRLVAGPRDAAYGLPSVVSGLHATGRVAFTVPPQVFVPPPQVESAVVVLDRVEAPPEAERAIELASSGFGQRRKMLRRSLAAVLTDPAGALVRAGIDPTARAEDLTVEQYVTLARI